MFKTGIAHDIVGEFQPGQFTLQSIGFMGGQHQLTTDKLSLIGEADTLTPDLPVTVLRMSRLLLGRRRGHQWYYAIQPGKRVLLMLERDEDGIRTEITFDDSKAYGNARRIIRQG